MHPRGSTLRRELCAVLCAMAALLCPTRIHGQTPTGQMNLEVKDPSGAALEAMGKLESLAPGVQRNFQTDAKGTYTLDSLPYGRYRLEVSKAGFATQSVLIDIQSATPISRTVTLALGAQTSQVDVIATTPLGGVDLPLNEIPSQVQTATQADIQNSSAIELGDFMNRRLNGVYVNETQDNPFQPDVNYRGFTASPLLGTPEGISVYVDGVRQNQPFGDVVSWDLIERNTVSEMALMPGSNPVFGLNTFGGAISVTTKDGISFPGWSGQALYGSSNRKSVDAEYGGGKATGFNWYLAGNAFHESGWRFDSPSDVKQGFVKLGWRSTKTDLALTSSFAYNTLTGNGIQDYRLLQSSYSSVYTIPDTTGNRSPSFNLSSGTASATRSRFQGTPGIGTSAPRRSTATRTTTLSVGRFINSARRTKRRSWRPAILVFRPTKMRLTQGIRASLASPMRCSSTTRTRRAMRQRSIRERYRMNSARPDSLLSADTPLGPPQSSDRRRRFRPWNRKLHAEHAIRLSPAGRRHRWRPGMAGRLDQRERLARRLSRQFAWGHAQREHLTRPIPLRQSRT